MQGAVIETVSTMPTIVSQSTCKAEYCMASLCVMAGSYIRKVFNETLIFFYTDLTLYQSELTPSRPWTLLFRLRTRPGHDILLAVIIFSVTVLETDQQESVNYTSTLLKDPWPLLDFKNPSESFSLARALTNIFNSTRSTQFVLTIVSGLRSQSQPSIFS
jgi:hypothetical protein